MDDLAYREFLAPNCVQKAYLILISTEIMCGSNFDIVKAFKYVCNISETSSKPMSASFRNNFLYGTVFR